MNGPLRVAVIDSGVHASHPHINGVAGGIGILADGTEDSDFTDRLGHGTAVTAVIREKAPAAAIFAVKIFHTALSAQIRPLIAAIAWCLRNRIDIINLSLGTSNPEHEPLLCDAVARAVAQECRIIAAGENDGIRWLPGILPGVITVELDWTCPRSEYRIWCDPAGRTIYRASGYPRPIPGVPAERNLKGLSFAVANVTGLLAASWPALAPRVDGTC
jgi:subtilisin family serine protease